MSDSFVASNDDLMDVDSIHGGDDSASNHGGSEHEEVDLTGGDGGEASAGEEEPLDHDDVRVAPLVASAAASLG